MIEIGLTQTVDIQDFPIEYKNLLRSWNQINNNGINGFLHDIDPKEWIKDVNQTDESESTIDFDAWQEEYDLIAEDDGEVKNLVVSFQSFLEAQGFDSNAPLVIRIWW